MSHVSLYWEPIAALNDIVLALWVGSLFYHIFGLQPSLGLLDQTQKISVLLQSLKKLFQFNWINAVIALICQGAMFIHLYLSNTANWSNYSDIIIIILMVFVQFYSFTTPYRKARRALRPKGPLFDKINTMLKLNIILGILNLILLNFISL